MSIKEYISIDLSTGDSIILQIFADNKDSLVRIDALDANINLEAPIQLTEGFFYEYQLPNGYSLRNTDKYLSGILSPSKANPSNGRLSPNIFVGTLKFEVLDNTSNPCGSVDLEVRSLKTEYREEYRFMLEEITEKCTELLMQYTSPANQPFDVDHKADSKSLYQRFAFIKSVFDSEEFWTAVHRITTNPVTAWRQTEEKKDVRSVRRMNRNVIKQLSTSTNRIPLPEGHSLQRHIKSVPEKVITYGKKDTVDTPENQFIKYALETFKNLCGDFISVSNENTRVHREAKVLEVELEEILNHTLFQDISRPSSLPLNSPVLQRKEGYREVLRVWLMINLAARLTWEGGEDVYESGKRDVATLYEYWLFFKLADLLNDLFNIQGLNPENFIEETDDKLGLKLKQGKKLNLKGKFLSKNRNLNVQLSFNRTFKRQGDYPSRGSWTQPMRPDYSLTIWPEEISENEAEEQELIAHIHFDAKYKVKNLTELFGQQNENLDVENEQENKGNYKRADLLKMHSYRDAIRRTAGAYILYPGKDSGQPWQGFHEIVPGLGAFTMRPNRNDDGSSDLRKFLMDVIEHFLNRTSQREQYSYQTYRTFKSKDDKQVNEPLPEPIGKNRDLIPDETFVLVGFYKSEEHLKWILNSGLYNTRVSDKNELLNLTQGETEARLLLLRTHKVTKTSRLISIKKKGPRVLSKKNLVDKGYPTIPSHEFYLVYEIEELEFDELKDITWDVTQLSSYVPGPQSALPFSVTLAELVKTKG